MFDLLLAQSSDSSLLYRILRPEVLVFLIPIFGIVCGCVASVAKTVARHRERLVMIENGFDPDGNSRDQV